MTKPPARAVLHALLSLILVMTIAPIVGAQGGPQPIPVGFEPFTRGDGNADTLVDISDVVSVLDHLFNSGVIGCLDSVDANDDELVDISDAIYVLSFLFQNGTPPAAPFPDCGADPTNDLQLGCASFPVCAPAVDRATAAHILRRIAYGPTPDELAELESIGADAFIAAQLDPINSYPDSDLQMQQMQLKIDAYPITSNYINYYRHVLLRGLYSKRQLLEQLTDFWSNHFNTYFWTLRSYLRTPEGGSYDAVQSRIVAMQLEAAEDDAFRTLALGSFEDLAIASATSVPMLVYLDNISNTAADPNENYARELLELHMVGVEGGYTQNDVEQLARCFTGWTICKINPLDIGDPHALCLPPDQPTGVWSFHFDAVAHDFGAKILFSTTSYPLTIPARPAASTDGVLDGFEVIAHLAGSSQTAEYVSTKLIRKFVSDTPPPALIAACIGTWLTTDGDIGAVMQTILSSPEFRGTTYRWNKAKTPLETILSTVRSLDGGTTNAQQMRVALGNLRHLPLNFDTPDGYPELGNDWIGTSKLVDTIHFNEIIHGGSAQLTYDPRAIQQAANPSIDESDPAQVVGFWLELMFPGGYNNVDEVIALDFFSTDDLGNPLGNPVVLVPGTPAYDLHLRKFLTFLRNWPQAMKQ